MRALATGVTHRAFAHRVANVRIDFFGVRGVDQRALRGVFIFQAIAHNERARSVRELLHEFSLHGRVHDETLRAYARLTRVTKLARHRALNGGVHVGVGAHHKRRVTTQLHAYALHGVRTLLHQ